jgi:hypothetical protein
MKKITDFTKATRADFDEIRKAIMDALKPVGDASGIVFKFTGKLSYSEGSFDVKITASAVQSDGTVSTPESERFKRYATMFGFKPTDLFTTCKLNGEEFKIIGLKQYQGKQPVILQKISDGKIYSGSTQAVKHALGRVSDIDFTKPSGGGKALRSQMKG